MYRTRNKWESHNQSQNTCVFMNVPALSEKFDVKSDMSGSNAHSLWEN